MNRALSRIATYRGGDRSAGSSIGSDEGDAQGANQKPRAAQRRVVWWDGVRLRMMADHGGESRDAAAWHPSVDDTLQYLADKAFNGRMAFEHLQALPEFRGRCPSLRTVRKRLGRMRPRDESSAWNVADSDDATARLILPVLASVIENTDGRRRWLSIEEARLVRKIRTVAPSIDAFDSYRVAHQYQLRAANEADSSDLDILLAFAPWEGPSADELYRLFLSKTPRRTQGRFGGRPGESLPANRIGRADLPKLAAVPSLRSGGGPDGSRPGKAADLFRTDRLNAY